MVRNYYVETWIRVSGDFMPFRFQGWTLYQRQVKLERDQYVMIYFFSKKKPSSGTPAKDMIRGYAIAISPKTGLPYLRKAKGKVEDKRILQQQLRYFVMSKTIRTRIDKLKKLNSREFEIRICKLAGAKASRHVGDEGIDGRIGRRWVLQIKQSEGVGRGVVDAFETAIRRERKKGGPNVNGMIVAFSFSKGAYAETVRAKKEDRLVIKLKTVKELVSKR